MSKRNTHNKKRVFKNSPNGYSYGQYTFLEENANVDFNSSDSLPENYDKFARKDLYTLVESHQLNAKIIKTMKNYGSTASDDYLRYNGGTFIRFDELELTRRPGITYGIKDVDIKVYMFSLYGASTDPNLGEDFFFDETNLRSPYVMVDDGAGGWNETNQLKTWTQYFADLWRTGDTFENHIDPGEIARAANFYAAGAGQGADDSTGKVPQFNNAVLVSSLNKGKNVANEFPKSAIYPAADIPGQAFNPNYKSTKYNHKNVSSGYFADEGYAQIGAFNINPKLGATLENNNVSQLFQEDGVYNPIYIVVQHRGDASVPGGGNDYLRNDRIQTFKINPYDLFEWAGNAPSGKISYFEFGGSNSLIMDETGQSAVAQTVTSLKITINTLGAEDIDPGDEYIKYLNDIRMPQPAINLFTLDNKILYLNPVNEIYYSRDLINWDSEINEMSDYTPFANIYQLDDYYDLQVYYKNELDRIKTSSPSTIKLNFGIAVGEGQLTDGMELIDRAPTIPSDVKIEYAFYVIDWDDVNNKFKNWNDVLNDYPTTITEFMNKQKDGLYEFGIVGKTSLTKSYYSPGIKNIKAVMFSYVKRDDGLVEPLRWKFIISRFFFDIPVSEIPDFGELGGADYTTIPWPYTTAVIGGVSQDSKYFKSITDTLAGGNIGNSDIIDEIFLVDAQENDKLGQNIEKMNLEQVRYFTNGLLDMTHLLKIPGVINETETQYFQDGETFSPSTPLFIAFNHNENRCYMTREGSTDLDGDGGGYDYMCASGEKANPALGFSTSGQTNSSSPNACCNMYFADNVDFTDNQEWSAETCGNDGLIDIYDMYYGTDVSWRNDFTAYECKIISYQAHEVVISTEFHPHTDKTYWDCRDWNTDRNYCFSGESSVGQIFINDNISKDLTDDCKLEFNTGNLSSNSLYDSSGRGNKGLLIGDYKIKKTQKNKSMRRDSFIKVPKKDTKKGAL